MLLVSLYYILRLAPYHLIFYLLDIWLSFIKEYKNTSDCRLALKTQWIACWSISIIIELLIQIFSPIFIIPERRMHWVLWLNIISTTDCSHHLICTLLIFKYLCLRYSITNFNYTFCKKYLDIYCAKS